MPVNDATQAAQQPGQAMPPNEPVEMSNLPPATGNRVSSLLHIVKPNTTPAAQPQPGSTGAWQSR